MIRDNVIMELLHERLRHIRKKAGHPSARSAAIRYGWSPSTYAAHENGQNSFDAEIALRYATAFKADPSWLLFGTESTPEDNNAGFVFKLVGYIRDRGVIHYIDRNDKPKSRTIVLFTSLPDDSFLFQVDDNSLWPRYDEGDLIVGRPVDFSDGHSILFEKDSIVILEDGNALLRQVYKTGSEGLYDLVSSNAPPMRNVRVGPSLIVNAVITSSGYAERHGSEAGYRP